MTKLCAQDLVEIPYFTHIIELGSSCIPFIQPRDIDILILTPSDVCDPLRRWGTMHGLRIRTIADLEEEGWSGHFALPDCWWRFHKGNKEELGIRIVFPTTRKTLVRKNVYREYLWLCYWRHGYTTYLTEEEKQMAIKLHDDWDYADSIKYEMEEEFQKAAKLYHKT